MQRHFHVNEPEPGKALEGEGVSNNSDDNDKEGVELIFDQIQHEQDNSDESDEEAEEVLPKKNIWYQRLSMLINHVINISYDCIYILGPIFSFEEMMI